MRVEFADIWADYLRKHYGRAETVAYMFGVTLSDGLQLAFGACLARRVTR